MTVVMSIVDRDLSYTSCKILHTFMSKNQPKFTQEEFHQFFFYRERQEPEGVYLFEGMGNKENTLSCL
jgi:hypothetical protein